MKIRLIRNATLRITYAGKEFIIDPFLLPKDTIPSFAGISKNPTVDLLCSPEEVVDGVEMAIVSHMHPDHFDQLAAQLLPVDITLFCQPGDEHMIRQFGITGATPIIDSTLWEGISITRTDGQHGSGVMAQQMGKVSGFVFQANGEPTVYWAGDTILYDGVRQVLSEIKPDVIITHSGGAQMQGSGPIIMDAEQTVSICLENPNATLVAVHLEALDHCPVTRAQLRDLARNSDIPDESLLIPQDGETIEL
ncbi:MAG: MBL fold metallo-hydrolase [Deltaproteobacteria bacterium]|nr:MBL fold metallo-hydrolase [Deltaproteobacteria bacterium]